MAMKKTLFLMIACLMVLSVQGQMKFMGIPFDMKIKKFDKELQEKGFAKTNELKGCQQYEGLYEGRKSQLFVGFPTSTKLVAFVRVDINGFSKEKAISTYQDFCDAFKKEFNKDKSVKSKTQKTDEDEFEHTFFVIPLTEKNNASNNIGIIALSAAKESSSQEAYEVQIFYIDAKNIDANMEHLTNLIESL